MQSGAKYFFYACADGKYDLMVKLYNYDNNLIKTCDYDDIFFCLNHIDIMKFIHSIDNQLYKRKNISGHSIFTDSCMNGKLEIVKFLHSIDNTQYINDNYFGKSSLECACIKMNIDIIEYLFSIDKDVFNKDKNKNRIVKYIMNSTNLDKIKILQIINENM